MIGHSRRRVLQLSAAASLAAPAALAGTRAKVVVVGGGFGGVATARALAAEGLSVTLVEPEATYTACPFSNAVIAGLRPITGQQFGYRRVARAGVKVVRDRAVALDAQAKTVTLLGGAVLPFDRAIVACGIDVRFDALPGYDEGAADVMPHAWKAGAQTLLLQRQLQAMDDGGVVIISVPANPYRCPPGPYERAGLIAHYLKTYKPRSKVLILDAKDAFSKQRLFQAAWSEIYGERVEWIGLSGGGKVTQVDAASRTLVTEFGKHTGAVVNVIAPQRAGAFARTAGLANDTGWCPIDPVNFESTLRPGVHLVGDAIIAGGMPKSAFAANAQAKACADAVSALLRGQSPIEPRLINTCYSLVAPDYGISVAGVYRPAKGLLTDVEGAGGVSPLDAPREVRALEGSYAEAWFKTITTETFG